MQVLKLSDNYSEILSTPRREFRYTNVTNADGSRKTQRNRRNSVRNAAIRLTTGISKLRNCAKQQDYFSTVPSYICGYPLEYLLGFCPNSRLKAFRKLE